MAPATRFGSEMDIVYRCSLAEDSVCATALIVSFSALVLLAVLSLSLSLFCCVSRNRFSSIPAATRGTESNRSPYHTFNGRGDQVTSSKSSFGGVRLKSRITGDGYSRMAVGREQGGELTLLRVDRSPPRLECTSDVSEDEYAYATTNREDYKMSNTKSSNETYAYARASNLDRIETDSDSDDEPTSDSVLSSVEMSPFNSSVTCQVSLDYSEVTTDQIFSQPPTSEEALFASFSHKNYSVIPKNALRSHKVIGTGEFGSVHMGVLNTTAGVAKCAIKVLHKSTDPRAKVKFLQEADIIGQFNHPQIVKLYGVVLDKPTIMIVLELLPLGDLRQQLINLKLSIETQSQASLRALFLSYTRQIAEGMKYLASKNFIHRDLAARNILMADEGVCKIGDFGLSRDLVDEELYLSKGGQIPVKWTAIEAIEYRRYSLASDVWSYGVLLFEIWSMGEKPFRWLDPAECLQRLKKGERLHPPPGCPRPVYRLMVECWHPEPMQRLTFADIFFRLGFDQKALLDPANFKGQDESLLLGSQLIAGEHLYPDLQQLYLD